MAFNTLEDLEVQEQLQILIDNGYGDLIDAFLLNDSKTYTKKGRLNKSGACRVLGWKTKQLEDAFKQCKALLDDQEDD